MDKPKEGLRLQLYMARSGVASRRKCETIIAQGRVRVDGFRVVKPGTIVTDEEVTLDGRPLRPVKNHVYIALNKPSGYLCSNADPQGRPLAMDLLRNAWSSRLHNVGRLDFLSSGLIFFTNDGGFTRLISHPSAQIEKEYLVETREDIPEDFLKQCKKGITLDGIHYRIQRYTYKAPTRVKLILIEGRNREIRRLFMHKRMKIRKLHRLRIGRVGIKGMGSGEYRFLSRKEIDSFTEHKGIHQ